MFNNPGPLIIDAQAADCSVNIYWASCGPSACAHMQGEDMCFLY